MNKKKRSTDADVVAPDLDDAPTGRSFNAVPWLAAITVLYLLFAVMYNVVTPAGSQAVVTPPGIQHNPDENGHLQYIQVLASGHLPVFKNSRTGPELHQPPLYYLLCTPIFLVAQHGGEAAAVHAVRCVSILFGVLMILVCYKGVRTLLPDEPEVALLTVAIVGLLPMNVATNASVGNDSLTNLLAAAALALFARIAMATVIEPTAAVIHAPDLDLGPDLDPTPRSKGVGSSRLPAPAMGRSTVLLGIVLGLIVYAKSSGIILFPSVLVGYAWLAYRKALKSSSAFAGALVSLGLGALLGAPWLVRNTVLYGDPLGQKLFTRSFSNTAQAVPVIHVIFHGNIVAYLGAVSSWTFASFWGVFIL